MTKTILHFVTFILIFSSAVPFATGQSAPQYEAELLYKEGSSARSVRVTITFNKDTLTVSPNKAKNVTAPMLAYSSINQAEYSYSRKIQLWEGLGSMAVFSALSGYVGILDLAVGLPFLLAKKKSHWLMISTQDSTYVFKLDPKTYRQLLLDLHTSGVKTEDAGEKKAPG